MKENGLGIDPLWLEYFNKLDAHEWAILTFLWRQRNGNRVQMKTLVYDGTHFSLFKMFRWIQGVAGKGFAYEEGDYLVFSDKTYELLKEKLPEEKKNDN